MRARSIASATDSLSRYNQCVTDTTDPWTTDEKRVDPSLSSGDGEPPVEDTDGDDGEPIRWVTVATFWQSEDAHLARIRLEDHDIPCVILDEQMGALGTFLASMIGGIKVQVPEEDVPRATQLLESPPPKDAGTQS